VAERRPSQGYGSALSQVRVFESGILSKEKEGVTLGYRMCWMYVNEGSSHSNGVARPSPAGIVRPRCCAYALSQLLS
jgi:hypothetical protein